MAANLGFGSNPYLQPAIDSALGDTVRAFNLTAQPAFNSAMVRSGSFGNSGVQEMNQEAQRQLQTSLGKQANDMRYGDWWQSQNLGFQQQQADRGFDLANQNLGMARDQFNRNFGFNQQQADRSYGFNQQQADRSFGLANENLNFSKDQFNRNLGLAQQQSDRNFGLANENLGFAKDQFAQNFGLAQQQADRNFGLANQGMTFQQQQADRNYGLANQGMAFNQQQADRNYGLANEAFDKSIFDTTFGQQNTQFNNALNVLQLQNQANLQNAQLGGQIQNTPFNYYQGFSNIANSIGQGFGTSNSTTDAQGSPLMGALGGAQLGSMFSGMFGGTNSMGNTTYNRSFDYGGFGSRSTPLGGFMYGSGASGD